MLKKFIIKPVDLIGQDLKQYNDTEQVSLKIAIAHLRKLDFTIISMVPSSMNKKQNTTADIIATEKGNDQLLTISVKNKGGAFTFSNLGTGTLSTKKWCSDPVILKELKIIEKNNLILRRKLSDEYARFEDISDKDLQNTYRFDVIKGYLTPVFTLCGTPSHFLFHDLERGSKLHEAITWRDP